MIGLIPTIEHSFLKLESHKLVISLLPTDLIQHILINGLGTAVGFMYAMDT